ncbi:hypothetical protein [Neobacillus sp. YIM B06451]|uniref:hypothetical protein n=1 Tax=Neobacillus sp. YIM B06451 TaxID=3070994 RepID=UPI00292DE830|nr:hypothetical protein [Neobacillus sp. YIM B06451]
MKGLLSLFLFLNMWLGFVETGSQMEQKVVSTFKSEDETPIEVTTKIKNAESKKGLWDITFTYSILNKAATNDVKLYFELEKMNESRDSFKKGKKEDIFSKKLKLKDKEEQDFKIKNLEIGQYKLILQAESKFDESSQFGGNTVFAFTIKNDGVIEGWEQEMKDYVPAVSETGEPAVIEALDSPNYGSFESASLTDDSSTHAMDEPVSDTTTEPSTDTTSDSSADTTTEPSTDITEEPAPKETSQIDIVEPSPIVKGEDATTASTASFSGYWKMYNRSGTATGVKYGKAELRYRDQYYIWRVAGTDYTDSTGYYSIPFTYQSNANLWELRIYSISQNAGKVENSSGGNFLSYAQWLSVSNGSNNPGSVYVPNGSSGNEVGRAFWVFDDLTRTEGRLDDYKAPGTSTIVWYSGSTHSAHYKLGGKIYLNDRSANSKNTTIHELGHNYMYNLYGGDYPPRDCSSGHWNSGESEPGCAWTEGWAHFLSLYMNNSSVYTYTDGSTWNAENTSTYPTGDDCEGRVAGALWDVYDSVNDGYDTYSYSFSSIYKAMYYTVNDTLKGWWNDWIANGYSSYAKNCLRQNSINY